MNRIIKHLLFFTSFWSQGCLPLDSMLWKNLILWKNLRFSSYFSDVLWCQARGSLELLLIKLCDIFSIRKSLKHFLLYGIIDLEIDRSPKKVSVTWCRNSVYTVPKLLVIVFQKQKDGNPHGRQLIHRWASLSC